MKFICTQKTNLLEFLAGVDYKEIKIRNEEA